MLEYLLWAVVAEAALIGWLIYHVIKIDNALDFILPDALQRIKDLEDQP